MKVSPCSAKANWIPTRKPSLTRLFRDDTVLTVRSLNGGFSELSDKANLSYSQSQSIVSFLIETYGQEKMTELLTALRDAKPIDDALLEVYGFDTDGLEDAWRQSVGAAPRAVSAQPTSQPTPTFVPTYVPVSGAPLAVTPTPYAIPTSSFTDRSHQQHLQPPFIMLTVALVCICLVILLIIGVVVIGIDCPLAKSKGRQKMSNIFSITKERRVTKAKIRKDIAS